jgi:E3 ubiquitin-protein ligase TRIP12
VLPFSVLDILSESEICEVLSGDRRDFILDDLLDNVVISHGYTPESPEIMMLFEIIAELEREHQRLLVRFLTGYAHLPLGGLAALDPKLTIAKREFSDRNIEPDDQLPSVMTCTNYFKVPSYSSKEIMRARIITAITEGQNSFELT